eukprot:CAMPEP_0171985902 /NCGR_PEP_ID=MMETSP0993-20121228/274595_1 /TAXON_ID=483369 /ORGANISM="non described non described, Strain CCMP2098" /LENGTH=1194 /DNA_ID=CAMNT_0012638793 /DNA_START=69 /DNA_END=3654 /DNA_ORIENTATION=-
MTYMYLTRYADHNPTCRELALLSINSFQKDLAASTQLVRALALRVLSSIRVPEIIQIQLLAVKKCASDSSPYVRKCAANAIPKIFRVDKEQLEPLVQILERLLKDSSCLVLGSAISAFNEVCPENWPVLHPCFRKLCHLLADLDEWAQILLLNTCAKYLRTQFCDPSPGARAANLASAQAGAARAPRADLDEWAQILLLNTCAKYLRTQFCDPSPGARAANLASAQSRSNAGAAGAGAGGVRKVKRRVVKKAFYSDEEDESCEEEVEVGAPVVAEAGSIFFDAEDSALDPDHRLLLRSSLPLLKSRNSGVVLAVCSLHYYCGTQSSLTGGLVGKALVRILRNAREIQFVVLKTIATMSKDRPQLFVPFMTDFYVRSTDPYFVRKLKLEVLTTLTEKDNVQALLRELQSYVTWEDKTFVSDVVAAVGRVGDAQPDIADRVTQGLAGLLRASGSAEVVCEAVVVVRHLAQQGSLTAPLLEQVLKLLTLTLLDDYGALPDRMPEYGEDGKEVVVGGGEGAGSAQGRREPPPLLPAAKASILWLLGEFYERLPLWLQACVPDVLRLSAQSFVDEPTEVKLQCVGLAVKLAVSLPQPGPVQQLAGHVLELARYDLDYDLRDRGRFATALLGLVPASLDPSSVDQSSLQALRSSARAVLLSNKLPPLTLLGKVAAEGLSSFTCGSLSACVDHTARGYEPLPEWPLVQPDASVREPVVEPSSSNPTAGGGAAGAGGKGFYGGDSDGSSSDSSSSSSSSSSDDSSDDGSGGDSSDSDDDSDGDGDSSGSGEESSSSGSDGSDDSDEGGEGGLLSSVSSAAPSPPPPPAESLLMGFSSGGGYGGQQTTVLPPSAVASALADPFGLSDLVGGGSADGSLASSLSPLGGHGSGAGGGGGASAGMMLDLMGGGGGMPAPAATVSDPFASASLVGGLEGLSLGGGGGAGLAVVAAPPGQQATGQQALSPPHTMLRREMGGGLLLTCQFSRSGGSSSGGGGGGGGPSAAVVLQLLVTFENTREEPLRNVRLNPPKDGAKLVPATVELPSDLAPGQKVGVPLQLHLSGSWATGQAKEVRADVRTHLGLFPTVLHVPVQELLAPLPLTEEAFAAAGLSLGGFNEASAKVTLAPPLAALPEKVTQVANFYSVAGAGTLGAGSWAATSVSGQRVLLSIKVDATSLAGAVIVKCDDPMLAATLLDVIKKGLSA